MRGVRKACGDGKQDIFGGRRGPQRSEVTDRVMAPANAIDEPFAQQTAQQVRRSRARTAETHSSVGRREHGQPFADEIVEQLEASISSLDTHRESE
jgi:hypothetical protein